jgi:hypothetical protein
MLDKYTLKNIKKVGHLNPSLKISNDNNVVSATLYIDTEDNDLEAIAVVSARRYSQIEGRPVYTITGTSGAYPGFGSLAYQSLLLALKDIDEMALLVSDRENITSYAEKLYEKMLDSAHIGHIKVPVDSACYAAELEHDIFDLILEKAGLPDMSYEEYLALDTDRYVLNNAYFINENSGMRALHDCLITNHEKRKLSPEQSDLVDEMRDFLGEWVDENYIELKNEMKNGYPSLSKKGSVYIELDM